jgi:pyruvate dehydrogenase E1 component alpha subunit
VRAGTARDLLAAESPELLETMYRRIVAARQWETTMKDLFVGGQDELYGAFHLYVGEEAVAVGVCSALRDDDYIASTHRGHGHLIAKGGDLDAMSAEIYFKQTGSNKGFGGSMHITDVSLGIMGTNGILSPQSYLIAGAAYGIKVRGTDQVAVAFFGEGSTNAMYYWSGIRNAVNENLPAIFVIENNLYHIACPSVRSIPGGNASTYTKGLPMSSVIVDGNDVAEVYAATKEAVDKARAGGGPSVIECLTYRWYDHYGFAGASVGEDGAFGLPYRPDSEVQAWIERDPIPRFRAFLEEEEFFTVAELDLMDTEVQAAVDGSIEFARNSPPVNPEDGTLYVYAEGRVPATQFLA